MRKRKEDEGVWEGSRRVKFCLRRVTQGVSPSRENVEEELLVVSTSLTPGNGTAGRGAKGGWDNGIYAGWRSRHARCVLAWSKERGDCR